MTTYEERAELHAIEKQLNDLAADGHTSGHGAAPPCPIGPGCAGCALFAAATDRWDAWWRRWEVARQRAAMTAATDAEMLDQLADDETDDAVEYYRLRAAAAAARANPDTRR